jgi:hypothetical protein
MVHRATARRAGFLALFITGVGVAALSEGRAGVAATEAAAMTTGYGVEEECLASGGECGRIVADAWCAARGFGPAASFGQSLNDEAGGASAPASEGVYRVACSRTARADVFAR